MISLSGNSYLVSRVAVNTTISASSACVTAILLSVATMGIFDVVLLVNGLLSGLVGITATCAIADPWMACIIGIVSCLVYACARRLLVRLRIDDPMEAASVHGFVGTWGLLSAGIFCTDSNVAYVHTGHFDPMNRACASGEQFGLQVVGGLCIMTWTCGMSFIGWQLIKYTIGLRVVAHVEEMGLDMVEHGRSAFAERRPFVGWAVESGGMAAHGLGDLKYDPSEHGFFSRKYAEVQAYARSRDTSSHTLQQQQQQQHQQHNIPHENGRAPEAHNAQASATPQPTPPTPHAHTSTAAAPVLQSPQHTLPSVSVPALQASAASTHIGILHPQSHVATMLPSSPPSSPPPQHMAVYSPAPQYPVTFAPMVNVGHPYTAANGGVPVPQLHSGQLQAF